MATKNKQEKTGIDGEDLVLFQKYFKSVGPRTYAAQVKRTTNGNHCLVVVESKREPGTDEVRKSRVYVWSEDFLSFFKMMQEALQFIKANPVPEEVRKRRERYWQKRAEENAGGDETDMVEINTPLSSLAPAKKAPAKATTSAEGVKTELMRQPVKPLVGVPVKPPSKPRPNGITIKPSGKNPPRPMERTALVKHTPGRPLVNRAPAAAGKPTARTTKK